MLGMLLGMWSQWDFLRFPSPVLYRPRWCCGSCCPVFCWNEHLSLLWEFSMQLPIHPTAMPENMGNLPPEHQQVTAASHHSFAYPPLFLALTPSWAPNWNNTTFLGRIRENQKQILLISLQVRSIGYVCYYSFQALTRRLSKKWFYSACFQATGFILIKLWMGFTGLHSI